MTIANEITNYANGLSDAYGAVNDMGGVIPQDKNMNNLDTSIRTIPQNLGPTYTAGTGINISAQDVISAVTTTFLWDNPDMKSIDRTPVTGAEVMNAFYAGGAIIEDASFIDPTDGVVIEYYTDGSDQVFIVQYTDVSTGTITNKKITYNGSTWSETSSTLAKTTDLPSNFTGATSSVAGTAGLVPAPTTSDPDKFLKGDGTWADAKGHILYIAYDDVNNRINLYKDESCTISATCQDLVNSLEAGINVVGFNDNNPTYLTISIATDMSDGDYMYFKINGVAWYNNTEIDGLNVVQVTQDIFDTYEAQTYLTPSYYYTYAEDKTFVGATSSVAGQRGLVPAPAAGNQDRFLKGDGTWGTPTDTTYSAGTNVQISASNVISATDTTYSNFTGATSSVAGANGLVPAPAAGDEAKALHGDGTWKDTTAKLVEMSYGESNAWAKFIAAYNAGSIVYCRASSNANPGTGSQTRKAFMAYVNNATNPTNVEFQYVRSQSSKTDSQQCDQVFVYTLTNTSGGTWSVASRNMSPKINVSGPITKTFTTGANAVVTIGADTMTGATSGAAGAAGVAPAPAAGDQDKVLTGAGTWDTRAKITMTSTDPGSGSALAADNYVAVYGNSDGQITSSDLANNAVSTAKLADSSVTNAKLDKTDLANNGEWVCVGQAYLAANTSGTVAVTVNIPAAFQGKKMQYKVVGAYEVPTTVAGATVFTQVQTGGTWLSSSFYADRYIMDGRAEDSMYTAGNSRIFGHRWFTTANWDSCAFEFTCAAAHTGSHWAFTGTAGGISGANPGTWSGGGRVQSGDAIQAIRLMCSQSVTWVQGSGIAIFARKKGV